MEGSILVQDFSLQADYHFKKASTKKNGIADIDGVLSKQTRDTQGEMIFIKGMDIDYLNTGYAQINWWHLGRQNPGMVVGFIDWAKKSNNETQVDFKGHLINTDAGRSAYDLMLAMEAEGKRMGVSVEGKVLTKDAATGNIFRSIARAAALATDQVNKECTASLLKAIMSYAPDINHELSLQKAISVTGNAIYGTNPLITTNLGAMSLEEQLEILSNEYPDISRDFLKSILYKLNRINHE